MTTLTFTPFPLLTTERLTLRQVLSDDAPDIFALRSDTEINKYLDRQPSQTLEDAILFIRSITDRIEKNESVYWAIILTESNVLVGTICLFEFSDKPEKCEIGFELSGRFQGKGIMQEAAKKVIEYAFQTIQVQTIEAFTHKNNQGSTKLLEKLAFEKQPEPDNLSPDYYVFTRSKTTTT